MDEYIPVGSIRVRYRRNGEGPPLLLLHGIGGSLEDWDCNVAQLGRQRCVYAIDLPGFGRSDKPELPYTLTTFADLLRELCDSLGLGRIDLAGHSLGGGVALAFAARNPERMGKLVLAAPVGMTRSIGLTLRAMTPPVVGEVLARPTRIGTGVFLRATVFNKALITEQMIDLSHELNNLPGSPEAFLATLRSLSDLSGLHQETLDEVAGYMKALAAPTLVVWGGDDEILPVEGAEVMRAALPGASVELLHECGHLLQVEKAEELNRLVGRFLSA